jgi:hypothetical protein
MDLIDTYSIFFCTTESGYESMVWMELSLADFLCRFLHPFLFISLFFQFTLMFPHVLKLCVANEALWWV